MTKFFSLPILTVIYKKNVLQLPLTSFKTYKQILDIFLFRY